MTALSRLVKSNLADRQFLAGVHLVSSSAMNAVAGVAFWFVAARGFDESTVGVNAVLITTLSTVTNLASLGMDKGLIRFIPSYGRRARALVVRTYALACLVTMVLAPVVGVVLVNQVDELSIFSSGAGLLAFAAACLVWIIFDLQDSVLVAIRKTRVVPVANLGHALVKLGLLLAFVATTPKWGIFTAWVVPLVLIVPWVNRIIFRTLRTFEGRGHGTPETGMVRFAAAEHGAKILNLGLFDLLPIYVLAELGERASAFYALAWTIAYNLMLINSNISTALLAEASHEVGQLPSQAAKALKQMALFVVPAVILLVVFAPLGLRVFGESYADEGTNLLRLLALVAIANMPVSIAIATLQARRQVARLFGLYALRTVFIGGLCVVLARRSGLNGLGWGWVIGEWAIALLVICAYFVAGPSRRTRPAPTLARPPTSPA
jgi:O-antigen/teichoic acid export membrane protein